MSGNVLFVAYHYPPIAVSSGVHRTLAFTRYLSEWGWAVSVITADYKAYPKYDLRQLDSIPPNIKVTRAWAKDTARDLAIRGRYTQLMALPDRYQSWILGGLLSGLKEIRRSRPNVIVSTYPIASAHVIGFLLHKITGIPWVADFRDPMAQDDYPDNPLVRKSFLWIERKAVKHASKMVFVTEAAKDYYCTRYPALNKGKAVVIPNGYDGVVFDEVEKELADAQVIEQKGADCEVSQPLVFLHSGVIYPSERDPQHLFQAIKSLKDNGIINCQIFKLILRASGHDDLFQGTLDRLGISDIVTFEPSIPYKDALREMYCVDGLLLLQADNCELQIPAKAYEYIRVGKPVLGLTTLSGETGKLLASHPLSRIAPLDDAKAIYEALQKMVADFGNVSNNSDIDVGVFSRESGAKALSELLKNISAE